MRPQGGPRRAHLAALLGGLLGLTPVSLTRAQETQVVRDGSIGPDASVQPELRSDPDAGSQLVIDEALGARPGAGPNLFHSFERFDIGRGDRVIFRADPMQTTANIIARITGELPSRISGVLASEAPGASLFFLNPSGIVLGPGASLEVPGSVHLSTASTLWFSNGERFSALRDGSGLSLSVAPPSAFGFREARPPASIQVSESALTTAEGRSLSLIGGDVEIRSTFLQSDSGSLSIGAVGAGARVPLAALFGGDRDPGLGPEVGPDLGLDLGLDVGSGGSIHADNALFAANGPNAAGIRLFGTSIELEDSAVLSDSSHARAAISILAGEGLRISGGLVSTGGGRGSISLRADRVRLEAGLSITSRFGDPGDGGDFEISAGTLEVFDSEILGFTTGVGRGGDIRLRASQSIAIQRSDVLTETASPLGGRGGHVELSAPSVSFAEGSRVGTRTSGSGRAGDLGVSSPRISVIGSGLGSESTELASGRSGDVRLLSGQLSISMGSLLGARALGNGDSGDVELRAREIRAEQSLLVDGSEGGDAGTILVVAQRLDANNLDVGSLTRFGGRSSDIRIHVTELDFTGLIATQALQGTAGNILIDAVRAHFGPGLTVILSAGTVASDGGDIELRADELELSRALVSAGDRNGRFGGDLRVVARSLSLDQATLTARNRVDVEVERLGLRSGSVIGSESGLPLLADPDVGTGTDVDRDSGPGAGGDAMGFEVVRAPAGDVRIVADRIELGGGSRISSTTFSDGDAGDVEVQAREIELSDRASIDSRSTGRKGDAGTLRIRADRLSLQSGARIATSSNGPGAAGSIELTISDRLLLDGSPGAPPAPTFDERSRFDGPTEFDERSGLDQRSGLDASDLGSAVDPRPRGAEISSSLVPDATLVTEPLRGDAGQIVIHAPTVELRDGAEISSSNLGTGRAGSIAIEGDRIDLTRSTIATDAQMGSPVGARSEGSIRLSARDRITIDGARITASVDSGRGGDIALQSDAVLVLRNDARVLAQTNTGNGGEIRIASESVFRDEGSRVSADAGVGQAGRVEVNAPERNLDAEIAAVEAEYVDPVDRIRPSCELRDRNESRLSLVAQRRSPRDTGKQVIEASIELEAPRSFALGSRTAMRAGDIEAASKLMDTAESALSDHPADIESVLVRLQLASSALELAEHEGAHASGLLRAHRLLHEAIDTARGLAEPRLASLAYGLLGRAYRADRRFGEALYLTRRASVAADAAGAIEIRYRWRRQEGELLWTLGRENESLDAYRRALTDLDQLASSVPEDPDQAARAFHREVEPVYLEFADRLLQRAERAEADARSPVPELTEARDTIERWRAAELRNYFRDDCSAEIEANTATLDRVAGDAAVVYPVVFPNRLELLVRLPSGLRRFRVPVGELELTQTATRFRRSVQDLLTSDYLRPGRSLYRWLVEPYLTELERQGIQTLVFVPGSRLRTIPLAALHDGENFLIEHFALAVTPGLSLVDPRPLEREGARILLAGVSEAVQDFEALPVVPRELEEIREVFGGEILQDEAFSPSALDRAVGENRPTMLHIASHVIFTGDPRESFVLTHAEKLSLDQLAEIISRTRYRSDPLELLVLSACRTALDDPQAGLGLAGISVRSGARSAVGSLWDIEDESSSELVVELYRQLKQPSRSRAEALRRAQLELLEDPELSHPFYWSAFVLVNNWL